MKKILLLLSVMVTQLAVAQTDVTFNILHKLGVQDFAFNQMTENDLGHQFQVDRLEYYLSQISIVHDGGQETSIDDLYILVNASEATSIELGNYDITTVESVKFYVGVDSMANHSDPAAYAATHPLAPQSPSMHWGWASGYRFIAIEGMAGTSLNQNFEIHSLGDNNYFQTEVSVTATADNGTIAIDLNADYGKALNYMELNGGLINHGFDDEALSLLLNFRSLVFSDANMVTAADELANVNVFEVYPNPSSGQSTLNLSLENNSNYEVTIQTILGTTVQSFTIQNLESTINLNLKNQGIYLISLIRNGKTILTEKLIVTP